MSSPKLRWVHHLASPSLTRFDNMGHINTSWELEALILVSPINHPSTNISIPKPTKGSVHLIIIAWSCPERKEILREKSPNNNPNFGRAVERERSELRNASPKERKSQEEKVEQKSQVWKQKLSRKWSQGNLGGSRERILPTCGPSLITPKGQRRDPDASDDKKT